MKVIVLSYWDLVLAAGLVLLLALLSFRLQLGIGRQLTFAAVRTFLQLLLIGLVLKLLFENDRLLWVMLMALIMLLVAGREVVSRQKHRLRGWWSFSVGTLSMFLSTFTVTVLVLLVIIGNDPWYDPQYAIPLLGMMLGNTMNGIALGVDRLTSAAWSQHAIIEARLMLGHSWQEAVADVRRESIRTGLIPIINAMAAAGVVSLPGMMTGQILAGTPPLEAVKYQILIMFMISAGTGFGTVTAIALTAKRLFDDRHRLRLEHLIGDGR